MKDRAHHLGTVQKKVIRSSRQEAEQESLRQPTAVVEPVQEPVREVAIEDHDVKRKMPRDYVRHTSQRERMH